ncbi:MAG: putative viral replication protein [Cressdnaviricota sp.]|nr:MAG: putative viral replication protein [Cressdnaviricota sp.]
MLCSLYTKMAKMEQVEQGGVGNTRTPPKRKLPKRETQSKHWCFTLNNPNEDSNLEQRESLFAKAEQAVFQLEEGEEKTPHWQGYVKLTKKARFSELQKLLMEQDVCHWHIEKCNNIKASVEYCQKDEGRLDGPWIKGFRAKVKDPLAGRELRPFQKEIVDLCSTEPDDRTVHWYYEKKGNVGKTSLAKSIAINNPKEMLYLTGKSADMKFAIQKFMESESNNLRIVLMDFTRSIEDYISYEGIEAIKNGIFFSGKYEGGMLVFESPHVICLANFKPDMDMLSKDRWKITKI